MPFFVNAPDALYSFQFDLVRLSVEAAKIMKFPRFSTCSMQISKNVVVLVERLGISDNKEEKVEYSRKGLRYAEKFVILQSRNKKSNDVKQRKHTGNLSECPHDGLDAFEGAYPQVWLASRNTRTIA